MVGYISLTSNILGFLASCWGQYHQTAAGPALFHFTNWYLVVAMGQLGLQCVGCIAIRRYRWLLTNERTPPSSLAQDVRVNMQEQRKEALAVHVWCMGSLLVFGCASPAVVQLTSLLLRLVDLPWLLYAPLSCLVLMSLFRPFCRDDSGFVLIDRAEDEQGETKTVSRMEDASDDLSHPLLATIA